jgi:hypothetical protein
MNTSDVSKLIQEIESTEPIKLLIKGRKEDTPKPIGFYNSKKQFVPDIVAKFSNKRDFYAIEKNISEKDVHLLVFKWILFASEARKYSGTFFLVIPKSKVELCNEVISEKQLDLTVIAV